MDYKALDQQILLMTSILPVCNYYSLIWILNQEMLYAHKGATQPIQDNLRKQVYDLEDKLISHMAFKIEKLGFTAGYES